MLLRPASDATVVLAAVLLTAAGPCRGPSADTATAQPTPAAAPPGPAPQPAAMRPLAASARLYASTTSQAGEPGLRVYRDAAAWAAAWQTLHAGLAAGAPPAVDFARDMVVLVAAGEQPSGGHGVRIDGTSEAPGGGLVVHVTRTVPGPDCMTAAVMTSPVEVVRVPRTAGAVRPLQRTVTEPCG